MRWGSFAFRLRFMDGSQNPIVESILFVVFIALACAVPLILAWQIITKTKKNKEKKK